MHKSKEIPQPYYKSGLRANLSTNVPMIRALTTNQDVTKQKSQTIDTSNLN